MQGQPEPGRHWAWRGGGLEFRVWITCPVLSEFSPQPYSAERGACSVLG